MSARSIASLSLSFGLVSIPVKLYSATESSASIRFKLLAGSGARVRQQYVADAPPEDFEAEPPASTPPVSQAHASRRGVANADEAADIEAASRERLPAA